MAYVYSGSPTKQLWRPGLADAAGPARTAGRRIGAEAAAQRHGGYGGRRCTAVVTAQRIGARRLRLCKDGRASCSVVHCSAVAGRGSGVPVAMQKRSCHQPLTSLPTEPSRIHVPPNSDERDGEEICFKASVSARVSQPPSRSMRWLEHPLAQGGTAARAETDRAGREANRRGAGGRGEGAKLQSLQLAADPQARRNSSSTQRMPSHIPTAWIRGSRLAWCPVTVLVPRSCSGSLRVQAPSDQAGSSWPSVPPRPPRLHHAAPAARCRWHGFGPFLAGPRPHASTTFLFFESRIQSQSLSPSRASHVNRLAGARPAAQPCKPEHFPGVGYQSAQGVTRDSVCLAPPSPCTDMHTAPFQAAGDGETDTLDRRSNTRTRMHRRPHHPPAGGPTACEQCTSLSSIGTVGTV